MITKLTTHLSYKGKSMQQQLTPLCDRNTYSNLCYLYISHCRDRSHVQDASGVHTSIHGSVSSAVTVGYLMFPLCLTFRTTDETDLLSLWTNHGNQSFPRQRIFICEVCGHLISNSFFSFCSHCTRCDALILGQVQGPVCFILHREETC